jgi:hypothetical protein
MIDGTLYENRDEFFSDLQAGDLVFLQADDGSEASGIAMKRSWLGWVLDGGQEVIEDENYLGHVSHKHLTGVVA